ncbi:hypothetical protein EV182_006990, partial [Spiromyces aspiralis]
MPPQIGIQPNLLFVTPLLLAIVLISAKYFGTAEAKGAAPRNMALNGNTATNSPEAVPSCEGANLERIARELAESLVASQPKGGPKPPDPPTSFHVARALVTADPQIHLNATFNQNTTGSYCLLYDYCVAHSHLVDWSYPQYTRLILIGLVGLQALLMLVLYWVPERAPWSDETGTMSFPSLDTYPPDPGYEWAPGSSWRVH